MLALRNRLIKAKKLLADTCKEQKSFLDKDIYHCLEQHTLAPVKQIDKQITAIEKEITKLIKADEKLNHLFTIITSVDGIGLITAAYILATTNEFISIAEAKKFACYCGVAPFEHTSGIRLKGKSRVSQKANKEVKTLFHMAALSTVRIKGDLQDYFHRKVAEGKNKMSVLNAIRNKLILRVFSCVNRNCVFQKNYKHNFAEP